MKQVSTLLQGFEGLKSTMEILVGANRIAKNHKAMLETKNLTALSGVGSWKTIHDLYNEAAKFPAMPKGIDALAGIASYAELTKGIRELNATSAFISSIARNNDVFQQINRLKIESSIPELFKLPAADILKRFAESSKQQVQLMSEARKFAEQLNSFRLNEVDASFVSVGILDAGLIENLEIEDPETFDNISALSAEASRVADEIPNSVDALPQFLNILAEYCCLLYEVAITRSWDEVRKASLIRLVEICVLLSVWRVNAHQLKSAGNSIQDECTTEQVAEKEKTL